MLNLSPCVEMFWHDLPYEERARKAAQLGFKAFEFWGYGNKDFEALRRVMGETGIKLAACGLTGPATSILLPEGVAGFIQAVKDCIPVSEALGVTTFIVTTGNELEGVPRELQHAALVGCLEAGAPVAEDAGLTLVLEPLNLLVDHAGYYLASSYEGFEIIGEVGSPAVKLLYDIYHQQITEGNLVPHFLAELDKVGHFHSANHPGRYELTKGEINYPFVLGAIRDSSYTGYVGMEYRVSDPARADELVAEALGLA
jgi:hydroxypyruvate isomerase